MTRLCFPRNIIWFRKCTSSFQEPLFSMRGDQTRSYNPASNLTQRVRNALGYRFKVLIIVQNTVPPTPHEDLPLNPSSCQSPCVEVAPALAASGPAAAATTAFPRLLACFSVSTAPSQYRVKKTKRCNATQ